MATKYLSEGATGFAAADWGGVAMAATDDFIIELPFGTIIGSELDQSGIVGGFESMTIKPGASGTIGGGSNGSFIADFDNDANAFVSNRGNVTIYLQAGGDSATINNFDCGPGSVNYLMGGTFALVTMGGGTLTANASTIITDYWHTGGTSEIMYHATDATEITITGGTLTLRRMPTTLNIQGGRVVFDPDDGEDFGSKTVNVTGGTLDWRAGAIPTVNADGGNIDFSNNRRAFTPGSTAFNLTGSRIISHPDVPMTNVTPRGAFKTSVGDAESTP